MGKLSSRRICGRAAGSARLIYQSGHLAGGVRGFGFSGRLPMGERSRATVVAGTLSALVGGGMWYFKEDAQEPVACKLTGEKALEVETMKARFMTEEEALKEEAMKKRFEEWMIKYGRTYKDKEEKAMRYERFKEIIAQYIDDLKARGLANSTDGPNCMGDQFDTEICPGFAFKKDPTVTETSW